MCGIVGYFREGGISSAGLHQALKAMDSIRHRGPDGSGAVLINSKTGDFRILHTLDQPAGAPADMTPGEYEEGSFDLFLGHRRLSIIDLSILGHQPMRDEAGNWIIFNGEFYNYREIREELKQKGHVFRSSSDTEVLMAALREWGADFINRINGMWAFVWWDNRNRKLLITNDRLNIKPLYYVSDAHEFIIVSEIKALGCFQHKLGNFHRENISIFLQSGYLDHDDTTFYQNVFRYPSQYLSYGHPTDFLGNHLPLRQYWSIPEQTDNNIREEEAIERFNFLLDDAIRLRMRADVEWGITFSGGLDSGSVAYHSYELLGRKPGFKTFSAVFPGQEGDESEFINHVRDDLGLDARTVNPLVEFSTEDLTENIWMYDYPSQSTSFYAQRSVMRLARNSGVKVLLEGQGGDELFAGYHHHFFRWCRELVLRGRLVDYFRNAKAWSQMKGVPLRDIHRITLIELKQSFNHFTGKKDPTPRPQWNWNAVNRLQDHLVEDMMHLTLQPYLRTDDRDSMAFGVETRLPFLDYRMVEFGMQLPSDLKIHDGWQKYIMRAAGHNLHEKVRFRKDKKGFTTPVNAWVNSNKRNWGEFLEEVRLNGFNVSPDLFLRSDANVLNVFRVFSLGVWLKLQRERMNPAYDTRNHDAVPVVLPTDPVHPRVCVRCILDENTAADIHFDENGVCNYCRKYDDQKKYYEIPEPRRRQRLEKLVQDIRDKGKGKKFDCILGVSGGVDSSYLAWQVKQLGIRPLIVHFDNGWNSEMAVSNIEKILNRLGFELYTYVVDWEEFRDLQLSYIKAGVLDWEIPTDHGFYALLYELAWKYRTPYILTGHNYSTEAILPPNMRWAKLDVANILDIHRKFGQVKLRTFPMLPFLKYNLIQNVLGVRMVPLLNYLGYDKKAAKETIIRELGWRDYGGKHYESIFTRFYQGYVLPKRFGIDKRVAHFSTLINSGQMTREEALEEMKLPPYDADLARSDKEYVIKKLGLTAAEFEQYMTQPIHSHQDYKSYTTGLYVAHERFFRSIRPFTRIAKKLMGKSPRSEKPAIFGETDS